MIFFLEYWLIAQNPARIVGRVRSESGQYIEFVSVYIASTTIGTSTDQNGSYQLDNLPSGQIKIVFQCVGFQKQMVEKII
ncbi:MAG: carboxypeptidase-like regulatory domain-containing protein, partial [Calditrichaeota bacterium]|nr:carboxypeptidase-like regulatory domain-containing protein [Calditrichota bacterium]